MKRIICLLLCLLLCGQVFAVGKYGVEAGMQAFLTEYGLNESNFSLSYYNLDTGESYGYNEDAFFPSGKLWTLPLHMYYYDEESNDAFLPPIGSNEEFQISGMSLEDCRYHSIILSDERVSETMRAEVGSLPLYLETVNTRYGLIAPEELPEAYWEGNVLSARYLMNCLQTVQAHPSVYTRMMENFRFAQKVDAFRGNSSPYVRVQIRGEADGFVGAVAEVYAEQPYLLVAFVSEEAGGDDVLAALNDMLCAHVEEVSGTEPTTRRGSSANENDSNGEQTEPSVKYYVGEGDDSQKELLVRWFLIAFGSAAVIAIIVGAVVLIKKKTKHRHR